MEIKGEVNVYHTVDEYFDVECELDMDKLAEELCQEYNLVDDVRMKEYFRSSVEDMVQEEIAGVRLDVSDNADAIDELREKIRQSDTDRDHSTGLTPEEFHTLVADIAKEIARAEICVALADAHK